MRGDLIFDRLDLDGDDRLLEDDFLAEKGANLGPNGPHGFDKAKVKKLFKGLASENGSAGRLCLARRLPRRV